MSFDRVCVYCASSRQTDAAYYEAAVTLGRSLAERGATVVYGGGAVGSMEALADAALAAGGKVIGVLPRFMYDLEWGHRRLTELRLVADHRHQGSHAMVVPRPPPGRSASGRRAHTRRRAESGLAVGRTPGARRVLQRGLG